MKMTVTLCICNYFNEFNYFKIKWNSIQETTTKWNRHQQKPDLVQLALDATGNDIHYFLKELQYWHNFRRYLCSNYTLPNGVLLVQVVPPVQERMDMKWNSMIMLMIYEKMQVEYLMSWLSTLGGGFSSLGDHSQQCALIAGKISQKQLYVGLRVGDPFVQSRCRLFYSISLIQTGKLKEAKRIIRQQYTFAIQQKEIDERLVKMCKGIWLKLQYAHYQQILKKNPLKAANILAINGFSVD